MCRCRRLIYQSLSRGRGSLRYGAAGGSGGVLIYDGTKRCSRNTSIYYLITSGQQLSVLGDIFVSVSRRLASSISLSM